MKALIIHALILCFGYSVSYAQFSEDVVDPSSSKKIFIGGSFNYNSSVNQSAPSFINGTNVLSTFVNQDSESQSHNINPVFGIRTNDHWILGLEFLFFNSKTEFEFNSNQFELIEFSSNSIGAFARYVFNPQNKFQAFLSPYIRYSSLKRSFIFDMSISNAFLTKETSTISGLSFGAQYELTSYLRATTNIGGFYYTSGTSSNQNSNSTEPNIDFSSSGFNFNGSSIFFGVEFLF